MGPRIFDCSYTRARLRRAHHTRCPTLVDPRPSSVRSSRIPRRRASSLTRRRHVVAYHLAALGFLAARRRDCRSRATVRTRDKSRADFFSSPPRRTDHAEHVTTHVRHYCLPVILSVQDNIVIHRFDDGVSPRKSSSSSSVPLPTPTDRASGARATAVGDGGQTRHLS